MTDHRIHTEADLDRGIDALVAADPRFAALIAIAGRPPLRRRTGGFGGLASAVVSQPLSTGSGGRPAVLPALPPRWPPSNFPPPAPPRSGAGSLPHSIPSNRRRSSARAR